MKKIISKYLLSVLLLLFIISMVFSQSPFYYPGYPKRLDTLRNSYGKASIPLITDFEKDGNKEIIVGACLPGGTCMLYVIKSDGTYQQGFPKLYQNSDFLLGYASGDIDRDGFLDIALRLYNSVDVIDRFGNHLQGFPVSLIYGFENTGHSNFIQIYDLDNDGKLEIAANKNGAIYVYNFNGQVRNGWPVTFPGEANWNTAIGDIDNDGFAEICATTAVYPGVLPYVDSSAFRIYRHNGANYSNVFPIYFDSLYDSLYDSFFGGLSLYIDKQNTSGNFISLYQSRTVSGLNKFCRITKFNRNAEVVKRNYHTLFGDPCPLSIGDFNNDNILDFTGGSQYQFCVFDSNFNILPGFPVQRKTSVNLTPLIGKLNNSSEKSFIVTGGQSSQGYGLWAGKIDGTFFTWSPLSPQWYQFSSSGFSIGDLNNDGQIEIISVFDSSFSANSYSVHLYVWTVPGIPYNNTDFPWPMYGHDRYRTFQYGFVPPDEPIGIVPINSNIPSGFSLQQNYPNPFNPSTKIRFDVPKESNGGNKTKLIIYDVLGREVSTLIDGLLKPGTYEVNWHGYNYPSGVYFYTILSGGYKETKKMVLIK